MCSWQQFRVLDLEREKFQIILDYKTVFENSISSSVTLPLFGILFTYLTFVICSESMSFAHFLIELLIIYLLNK